VARHLSQCFGGNRARLLGGGDEDLRRAWEKHTCDFVNGLIAHRSVDKINPTAGEILIPEGGELSRASWIVRAVEVYGGPLAHALETSRPTHGGNATGDGLIVKRCAAAFS